MIDMKNPEVHTVCNSLQDKDSTAMHSIAHTNGSHSHLVECISFRFVSWSRLISLVGDGNYTILGCQFGALRTRRRCRVPNWGQTARGPQGIFIVRLDGLESVRRQAECKTRAKTKDIYQYSNGEVMDVGQVKLLGRDNHCRTFHAFQLGWLLQRPKGVIGKDLHSTEYVSPPHPRPRSSSSFRIAQWSL